MKISIKTFFIAAILLICVSQVCYCAEEPVPEVQMASFSTFLSTTQHAGFGSLFKVGAKLAAKGAGKLGKVASKGAKTAGKAAKKGSSAAKKVAKKGAKKAAKKGAEQFEESQESGSNEQ